MADLPAAIDALEAELADLERQAGEIRNMINLLCRRIGRAPRYPESATAGSGPVLSTIKSDTFYGKKMQTAAREFLEMRKRADVGPAKPREILDALIAGGFEFDAKDETISLISLRSALRKNTTTFHRLPNGQYGLKAWYPNAKQSRDDDEQEAATERPAPKRAQKQPQKQRAARRPSRAGMEGPEEPKAAKPSSPQVGPFIEETMRDGEEWDTDNLKKEAIKRGIQGVDESTSKAVFHAALLGLKNRGVVQLISKGMWRIKTAAASEAAAA